MRISDWSSDVCSSDLGDGLINFAPDGIVAATVGDGSAALVENDGLIAASGGRIVLSAAAARDVVNASVNVTGVVRADSISQKEIGRASGREQGGQYV